jgi:hypothetical protein
MKRLYGRVGRLAAVLLAVAVLLLGSSHAMAQEVNEYRQFLGIDSRKLIWFLAQMHLFFGAFVLGVPLFAVIIEVVGWRNKDARFDKLAYEFTSLLSVAYATTAALGGLLAFALFTLYPTFMGYMAGVFKDVMFVYALLFFAETFCLYLYYTTTAGTGSRARCVSASPSDGSSRGWAASCYCWGSRSFSAFGGRT